MTEPVKVVKMGIDSQLFHINKKSLYHAPVSLMYMYLFVYQLINETKSCLKVTS